MQVVAQADKQQAVIYLVILAVLEVLLFIFTMAAGQRDTLMFNVMRILLLIGAHCLKNVTWAAYYTIFALIAALFAIDPVGLWLSGHGQAHTSTQNAFAFILLLCCIGAVIIGYFYKKALESETEQDFIGDAQPAGYTNPNERNQFLYREGTNAAPAEPKPRFQQFSGQAYSLG